MFELPPDAIINSWQPRQEIFNEGLLVGPGFRLIPKDVGGSPNSNLVRSRFVGQLVPSRWNQPLTALFCVLLKEPRASLISGKAAETVFERPECPAFVKRERSDDDADLFSTYRCVRGPLQSREDVQHAGKKNKKKSRSVICMKRYITKSKSRRESDLQ